MRAFNSRPAGLSHVENIHGAVCRLDQLLFVDISTTNYITDALTYMFSLEKSNPAVTLHSNEWFFKYSRDRTNMLNPDTETARFNTTFQTAAVRRASPLFLRSQFQLDIYKLVQHGTIIIAK